MKIKLDEVDNKEEKTIVLSQLIDENVKQEDDK